MHQIRIRLGLCPDPAGGAHSTPPDPLAGFKGAYREREGVKGGERKGKGGREGRDRGGGEWERRGEEGGGERR